MFTVLIPALKQGYLESQLYWLSQQKYNDFNVVVMDAYYKQNRYYPWASAKYPFKFYHVPLVHNVNAHKICDYSVKNNLALLSPTNDFIFLSDTGYVTRNFAQTVHDFVFKKKIAAFSSHTVLYTAFDSNSKSVDLGGQTDHQSQPTILFNRKLFFYVLNGFDEATTSASKYEFICDRLVNTGESITPLEGQLFHILHQPNSNSFGKFWRMPCDKCSDLFSQWKFDMAAETGEFPMQGDSEVMDQMMFMDPNIGIPMFECPNCGYGGCTDPRKHQYLIQSERVTEAPQSALDGRTGRNLSEIYETLTTKVENDIMAKVAYLKTTY